MTVRSVSDNQTEILRGIMQLHSPEGFDVDLTYGNGGFWKELPRPHYCFDIDPLDSHVVCASSVSVPLPSESVNSVVFDPPFLTYVRAGRTGNGGMVMAKRFAGYWKYDELKDHYVNTLRESYRVLRRGGIMVFKCQDIVHNHRLHPTHSYVMRWAEDTGLRLLDLFILAAKHRMPAPNRAGKQRHSRIFHSYFVVLKKP